MLGSVLVIVFWPFGSGVIAVVDGDMAVEWRDLECRMRCWGLCCNAVGWAGSKCCHFQDTGAGFEAGDEAIVIIINHVVLADGGCVGVVSSDMAGVGGDRGFGVVLSRGVVCIRALTVEVGVVQVLELVVSRVVGSVCVPSSIPTFHSCVCGSTQLSAP